MTTITLESPSTTGRLEELVDRLLATMFRDDVEWPTPAPNLVRTVHDARRLRQSGDLDGALALFTGVDTTGASDTQLGWLYAEWLNIARRRFTGGGVVYSPATGRAAVLLPTGGDGTTLAVAAVLGLRWPVGKTVSRRSLRGLKPLAKGGV